MTPASPASTPWRAFVALGASQGDRAQTLAAVVGHFAAKAEEGCTFSKSSRVYETSPIGAATNRFLNAVIELHCTRPPAQLLALLLALETRHGRDRGGGQTRWSDRPLDLDLIVGVRSDDSALRCEQPGLRLPHPRAHERDFVLAPLCELAPQARLAGRAVFEHLRALPNAQRTILAVHAPLRP